MPIAVLDAGAGGGAPPAAVTEAQWSVRRRQEVKPAPSWGRWGPIVRFAFLLLLLLMS